MLVSIIIPTYQEAANISQLVREISQVLTASEISHEFLVMDDNSPDGTGQVANALAYHYPLRCIRRRKKGRSLAAAVIEGFRHARGEVFVIMDADFSHPPTALPQLLAPLLNDTADLVVGSRYLMGGGVEKWPWYRLWLSRFGAALTFGLTHMTDPTSGFMAIRRTYIPISKLRPIGWKIVLELVVKNPDARYAEIPIVFRNRLWGTSKFGTWEMLQYIAHVLRLYLYTFRTFREAAIPLLVRLSGLGIDTVITAAFFYGLNSSLPLAAVPGFLGALASTYLINKVVKINGSAHSRVQYSASLVWQQQGIALVARLLIIWVLSSIFLHLASYPLLLNFIGISFGAFASFSFTCFVAFFPGSRQGRTNQL
jgi:dolichol-phosphate mannosyltransferase